MEEMKQTIIEALYEYDSTIETRSGNDCGYFNGEDMIVVYKDGKKYIIQLQEA